MEIQINRDGWTVQWTTEVFNMERCMVLHNRKWYIEASDLKKKYSRNTSEPINIYCHDVIEFENFVFENDWHFVLASTCVTCILVNGVRDSLMYQ